MADDAVLDEIQDNTKEAGQRLSDADYRELVSRLSTSLAMVEAAYMEARRRG
jgi:flagellin-like hook-associated protein FlgL